VLIIGSLKKNQAVSLRMSERAPETHGPAAAGPFSQLPRPPHVDAKERFEDQARSLQDAAMAMRKQLKHVKTCQSSGPELSEQGKEDLKNKAEHLQGALGCYSAIRKMLIGRSLAIEDEYDDLEPGEDKDLLIQVYDRMSNMASRTEINIYKLLGVEDSWFSARGLKFKRWALENPKVACTIVTTCAGAFLGALALLSENGIDILMQLHLSRTLHTVGQIALFGGVAGACIGVLLLLAVHLAKSDYAEAYKTDEANAKVQQVNQTLEEIKRLPHSVFLEELKNLEEMCTELNRTIPDHDDRMCAICLSEGTEVKAPIKTPGCKGMHFMCKNHWRQYLRHSGTGVHNTRCPVCRQ